MARASQFDAAEYLDTPEAIADYLSEAFESGDEKLIARALGTVTRAKGMMEARSPQDGLSGAKPIDLPTTKAMGFAKAQPILRADLLYESDGESSLMANFVRIKPKPREKIKICGSKTQPPKRPEKSK